MVKARLLASLQPPSPTLWPRGGWHSTTPVQPLTAVPRGSHHASVARGSHRPLEGHHLSRVPHPEHGHARDGRRQVVLGARVYRVRGPDDEHHVRRREVAVDLIDFEHALVRDAGLSEVHIELPRHAPGHRVDAKAHLPQPAATKRARRPGPSDKAGQGQAEGEGGRAAFLCYRLKLFACAFLSNLSLALFPNVFSLRFSLALSLAFFPSTFPWHICLRFPLALLPGVFPWTFP